jgi:hypothetical protein
LSLKLLFQLEQNFPISSLKNAFAFFNDEIESFAPVGIKALDSKI